jgi:hypothetical protein
MYVVYESATGRLVSTASDPSLIANPLPSGLGVKEVAEPGARAAWDEQALVFVEAQGPRVMTRLEFLRRFTSSERIATRAAAVGNPAIADMLALQDAAGYIDLDDPDTQAGVAYLESLGVIAAGRAAQVLA